MKELQGDYGVLFAHASTAVVNGTLILQMLAYWQATIQATAKARPKTE